LSQAPQGEPDPDVLLDQLREAAGSPPLPPLSVADPSPSARRGAAGALVSGARRSVVRLLTPVLGDFISQLERDRHRQRAEMARLEDRIALLEAELAARRGEPDRPA
jgi:hypothetical protein